MKVARVLVVAALLVIAYNPSKAQESPRWVTFQGTATTQGSSYILNASSEGGGSISISKKDVKVYGHHIRVRVGVPSKIVAEPKISESAAADKLTGNVATCHEQADCSTKCCACIGAIRICCGSGETRGSCLGEWGCPK
jgi:hypothetical protein